MLSRRDLIRAGAAVTGAGAARLLGAPGAATAAAPDGTAFAHGVASGDPAPDRVVIWTRVSGHPDPVALRWTVARDEGLTDVVAGGEVLVGADTDHTAHVDVAGLEPATAYAFGFDLAGARSTVGRTRTAPAAGDTREVRLGVVSCSSFAAGPFSVYRQLAEADVDLVLHLGDYLYDRSSGPREHEPPEPPTTLADYRSRHAQQRSDPDLQRLHASAPVSAVWDDHDVAGNAWRGGADDHDPEADGDWEERRAAGIRAWLEWLPVRLPDPARPERIWRQLPYGVADLLLLDTRHDGRDQQLAPADGDEANLADPDRSLLSDDQRRWLLESLAASTAPWRVLGNQVVLTPLGIEVPEPLAGASGDLGLTIAGRVINPDAWDGYPVERSRLLEAVAAAGPTFVLTGDVHSSWAFEVPGADGEPVTVEWVTPSVTAQPFASIVRLPTPSLAGGVVDLVAEQLPQVRWAEITEHGYVVVAVTAERAQADWWHVDLDSGERSHAASWSVPSGAATLEEATPLAARVDEPAAGVPPGAPPPAGPVAVGDGDGGDRTLAGPLAGLGVVGAAIAAAVAVRRRNRRGG